MSTPELPPEVPKSVQKMLVAELRQHLEVRKLSTEGSYFFRKRFE